MCVPVGGKRLVKEMSFWPHALHHPKRVPVCFGQDNVNLVLQVDPQGISEVGEKASLSVAVLTEDDVYSLGSSI